MHAYMFVYAYTYVYVCVYACVYVFYKFCSLQRILLQRLNSGICKVNYKRCMSNDQMSSERSQRDVEETRKRSVEMIGEPFDPVKLLGENHNQTERSNYYV